MATLNTVLHSSESVGEVGIEPSTRRVNQLSQTSRKPVAEERRCTGRIKTAEELDNLTEQKNIIHFIKPKD
jgi:hypothetical protein